MSRHAAWSVAVFASDSRLLPSDQEPNLLLDTRKLWRSPWGVRVRADPCLYVRGDTLYLFVEAQTADRPAFVEVYATTDLATWHYLGEALREPFHVSYPQVFDIDGEPWLLAETRQAGQMRLYRFDDFPLRATCERVLLSAPVLDPTPFRVDGVWYVYGTIGEELRLFVNDDLRAGSLREHPCGVIERRSNYARCGGPVIHRGTHLYRLAQNQRTRYGDNLSLFRIDRVDREQYRETLVCDRLIDTRYPWARNGSHHLSSVRFKDQWVLAMDGQTDDYYLHKVSGRIANLGDALRARVRRR